MSAIYIHIPFCKSRCAYCDFFSTIQLEKRQPLINAICKELEIRQNYLPDKMVHSIYFGGGTPSLLTAEQIQRVLNQIKDLFPISDDAEITLEANPGDLNEKELNMLHHIGINRLSIGIQSFHNRLLQTIGRRHTAKEAIEAVQTAQKVGFDNISIDLIYGLPTQTISEWTNDLNQAINLNIQHISAYGLTYEHGTILDQKRQKGELKTCSDEQMNKMYDILCNKLNNNGFEKYEVSNFSKKNFHSHHNSSYWNGTPYLGLGPAAHSFDCMSRQWNIASLDAYIQGMEINQPSFEKEQLSLQNRYDEMIMLSLRTTTGINMKKLEQTFGKELLNYCQKQALPYLQSGMLILKNDHIAATQDGFKILNIITETLLQE